MNAKATLVVAKLAASSADFIQTHPQAAEFVARRIAEILESTARRELEDDREREERARCTGRSAY